MGEPVDPVAEQPNAGDTAAPPVPSPQETVLSPQETVPSPEASSVGDLPRMLDGLDRRPLAEHAEVFEELHAHLQGTLAEIDGG
jgi:hypothetical protein